MSFFFSEEKSIQQKKFNKLIPIHAAAKLGCSICPITSRKALIEKAEPLGSDTPIIYFLLSKYETSEETFCDEFIESLLNVFGVEEIENKCRFNAITNCLSCDEKDREMSIVSCKSRILSDIDKSSPKIVVPIGKEAFYWIMEENTLYDWAGQFFPHELNNKSYWVYPIFGLEDIVSKQKVMRNGDIKKTEWDDLYVQHLQYLKVSLEGLQEPVVRKDYLDNIKWIEGDSEENLSTIFKWLDKLEQEPILAFDIETNMLSSFKEDSRLLTISFGTENFTVAFPYEYESVNYWKNGRYEKLTERLKNFFNKGIIFICHNVAFELLWVVRKFRKTCLDGSYWVDTQAQSYVLNNKQGRHSLDYRIKLYFGFWLKALSNLDRRKMEFYPLSQILPYNALDVSWTYKLYFKQQKHVEKIDGQAKLVEELYRTRLNLTKVELTGVVPNFDKINFYNKKFKLELEKVEQEIKNNTDVKKYEAKYGSFNFDSPKQLLKFFTEICEYADELIVEERKTKKKKQSTDVSVLSKLNHPVAKSILQNREIAKKQDAFILPLYEHSNTVDGLIHSSLNCYSTGTWRLSCNAPNLQQFPSRKGKEIREVIKAPEGHFIVASDLGQIEARIIAVASQDKTYLEMVRHNYDCHLEWAKKLANAYPNVIGGEKYLDDEKVIIKYRKDVKNIWTFPLFFGSSLYSVQKAVKIPLDVLRPVYLEFWDTFSGVRKWQEWLVKEYKINGYVENLFGHRRYGPLGYNEIINTPIQSTAAILCISALNRLVEGGVKVVMSIHDDNTIIVPENDLEEAVIKIANEMVTLECASFINLPLSAEISFGKDWFNQEELGTFYTYDFEDVSTEIYDDYAFYRDWRK